MGSIFPISVSCINDKLVKSKLAKILARRRQPFSEERFLTIFLSVLKEHQEKFKIFFFLFVSSKCGIFFTAQKITKIVPSRHQVVFNNVRVYLLSNMSKEDFTQKNL